MNSILLVEDTAVLAEQIADILRMEGYTVVIAGNGLNALRRLEAFQPQIIVTDLLMPEMDGFAFIDALRKKSEWRDIPVVVLTAKPGEETDDRLATLEINAVLRKPCEADELLSVLHTFGPPCEKHANGLESATS